jgi:UDP-N-acetylglucosamine--N-acetylmuramyl-(pentapeptide) pyrophosphoryl-undecaprenol N-acetylglucosamine transferase
LQNLASPFYTIAGFFQALKILKEFKPDCVFGTGSFIQVPVVYAAWSLKIPVVLHQQDVIPSLANKLCQLFAKKITVTFESSLNSFSSNFGIFYKKKSIDKIVLTGNPFREELAGIPKDQALKNLGLKSDLPVLLVLGGGAGSAFLNKLVEDALPEISKTFQILHATGKNKSKLKASNNYYPLEFISDMGSAYSVAEIVVCRAGISTITELSNLKKLSIIIPMPKSHQEINGYLLAHMAAAIVLRQDMVVPLGFVRLLRKILFEGDAQKYVRENIGEIMPKNSSEKIAHIILKIYNDGKK